MELAGFSGSFGVDCRDGWNFVYPAETAPNTASTAAPEEYQGTAWHETLNLVSHQIAPFIVVDSVFHVDYLHFVRDSRYLTVRRGVLLAMSHSDGHRRRTVADGSRKRTSLHSRRLRLILMPEWHGVRYTANAGTQHSE